MEYPPISPIPDPLELRDAHNAPSDLRMMQARGMRHPRPDEELDLDNASERQVLHAAIWKLRAVRGFLTGAIRNVRRGEAFGEPAFLLGVGVELEEIVEDLNTLGDAHLEALARDVDVPDSDPPTTPPDSLPPRKAIGRPTIVVTPDSVTRVDGTERVTREPGNWFPLVQAIRMAKPGDVIGLQPGARFAGGDIGFGAPSKGKTAVWSSGRPVTDVSIVTNRAEQPLGALPVDADDPGPNDADKPRAIVYDIQVGGRIDSVGGGGVDELVFADVDLANTRSRPTPLIVVKGARCGMLRVYDAHLVADDSGAWGGYGMKWGSRGAGRARYDLRGLVSHGAQEHGFAYLDSVGWDGAGDSYFGQLRAEAPSGRTGLQIVNRVNNPGPSGSGSLVFEDLDFWTEPGGGGYGLTIAGHLGNVVVRNYKYRGSLGALVVWSDAGKGLHRFDELGKFTTGDVVLENLEVRASSAIGYPPIALGGARSVSFLGSLSVHSNQPAAVDVDNPFSGPVPCGPVSFTGLRDVEIELPNGVPLRVQMARRAAVELDNAWS